LFETVMDCFGVVMLMDADFVRKKRGPYKNLGPKFQTAALPAIAHC
jgi:hypothetical protein